MGTGNWYIKLPGNGGILKCGCMNLNLVLG